MPETYATYAEWKRAVNQFIFKHFGLSLDDLPDLTFPRDAFDDGMTPEVFFNEEIYRVMLEEFGPSVNEIWPKADPPEDG